jgi:hypothetical protein
MAGSSMTAHALGRMRHLDLLALWCQLHPQEDPRLMGAVSKERLAAAILRETP